MCKVYNKIGSLNTIQCHLVKNNLDEFYSLDELIKFQRDYHFNEQKFIFNQTRLIQQEKVILEKDIAELNNTISTGRYDLEKQLQQRLDYFNRQIENLPVTNADNIWTFKAHWMYLIIRIKILLTQFIFQLKIFFSIRQSKKLLSKKNKRFKYIDTNFEDAVNQSSLQQLQTLQRKRGIINEINNSIYGAVGEQKVMNVLETLSDDYILINDFTCSFQPPIYHRNQNDYIKSVQMDHILISPSGIFLIETKNWSEHSIAKIQFSPVQQVKRTSFALFKILSGEKNKSIWAFNKLPWGNRKIPIRNLIVFINNKPHEEFQFVKILELRELLGYIKYFTPCYTIEETQMIADYLLKFVERKETTSKLNA